MQLILESTLWCYHCSYRKNIDTVNVCVFKVNSNVNININIIVLIIILL